jgi:hypothetical protein
MQPKKRSLAGRRIKMVNAGPDQTDSPQFGEVVRCYDGGTPIHVCSRAFRHSHREENEWLSTDSHDGKVV